jgi:peptidyl-prolyl cis-trans isomerase B (cyclophilin B)
MLTSTGLALIALVSAFPPSQASPAPSPAPPEVRPVPDGPVIAFDTTKGTFEVTLYATLAPLSTRNIMNYVRNGFYAGTTFHRVIPGFMIQGGGLDTKMEEKPTGPPVRNEARNGLVNRRGSLSLARTSDPHSATSQFFVSVKDNPGLDFGISRDGWGYAVFGEVTSGMDVVDSIVSVPTTRVGPHENVPITPVLINKVRIISEPAPPPPAVSKAGAPASGKPGASAPKATPKATPKASPAATKPRPKPASTPTPR